MSCVAARLSMEGLCWKGEVDVNPAYQIRPAEKDDVESLRRLSALWAKEGCTRGYPAFGEGDDRPGKWFKSGYLWVAEEDGAVIGYVAGVINTGRGPVFKPEGEPYLHIHELYVHPDHRRCGAGRRLVDAILDQAAAAGIHRSIVASGNVDWEATYRFYERHGFRMLSMEMYR